MTGTPRKGGPVVGFLVRFAIALAVGELLFALFLLDSRALSAFLAGNAQIATAVLGCFGREVYAVGSQVLGEGTSLRVGLGCDGSQPCLLFGVGILAFPAPWKWRAIGLVGGVSLLLLLNLVRIISLVWVDSAYPDFFDELHLFVWPVLFTLAVAALWMQWMRMSIARRA